MSRMVLRNLSAAPSAVLFDAIGVGINTSGTSGSWAHDPAAGAVVIANIFCRQNTAPTAVTFGGAAMTLHASVNNNNTATSGRFFQYIKTGVAAGSQNIAVTKTNGIWMANSISFTGVNTIQTAVTTFGTLGGFGGAFSHNVTGVLTGEYLLQGFSWNHGSVGGVGGTPTGGTNHWKYDNTSTGTSANTATGNTTFAGSIPWAGQWASIATRLSP
jgi:hypothetical protein